MAFSSGFILDVIFSRLFTFDVLFLLCYKVAAIIITTYHDMLL